jgi:hypothetical protein
VHNTGFPLLLGLRLRFCLRGKQASYSNFFFHFNSVFLLWSVFAAATDGKPGNVGGKQKPKLIKKHGSRKVNRVGIKY